MYLRIQKKQVHESERVVKSTLKFCVKEKKQCLN